MYEYMHDHARVWMNVYIYMYAYMYNTSNNVFMYDSVCMYVYVKIFSCVLSEL